MTPLRLTALVVCAVFLSAGCQAYNISRYELNRVVKGERFVETRTGTDPMPVVITLRSKETISLYDGNGNEVRTTTVMNVKPKSLKNVDRAQVIRFSQNRLGIVVGALLALGAGITSFYLVKTYY